MMSDIICQQKNRREENMNAKKILTVSLFGGMVFLSSIFAAQGALLTDIIEVFHPESSSQGYTSLFSSIGGMVAFVTAFFLIGRVEKIRLLQIGVIICSAFLVLLSVTGRYAVYIAFWFLCGIGMGFIDTLLSSCIADMYTGAKATSMMCYLHMTFGISSMAAPIIYSLLKKAGIAWRGIYIVVAVLGIIVAFVLFVSGRRIAASGESSAVRTERAMSISGMLSAARGGSLPFFILAMFTHGLFLGGLNAWLTHFVSVTLSCDFGSIALSFLFLGVLVSRFAFPFTGIEVRKYLSTAGIIAGILYGFSLVTGNAIIICVVAAVSAMCFGAMIPCMLDTACAEMDGNSMFATTSMMLALYLGQGISSPILGWFEKNVGLKYGMLLCAFFMIVTSIINRISARTAH